MKSISLALACVVVAFPLAGAAQQRNPNIISTNLPGVTSIASPSEDFDPINASDEDLAYYGFPPRPDRGTDNDAYASWVKAMKASKTRIVPTLKESPRAYGPTRFHKGVNSNTDEGPFVSDNWSGYVNVSGVKKYGKYSFWYVMSNFIVPPAMQAFGACTGGEDYGGSWIGIDGYNSTGLLQSGIEYDAYCGGGATSTNYAVWYEWYPANQVYVTNMPIAPGDDYFVEVWNSSPTQGYAYLLNFSTETAMQISFTAPSGGALIGDSVEWIIERPGGNTLTNYVADPFWNASGGTFAGRTVDPKDSKAAVMTDDSGNWISYPTLLGTKSFLMRDESTAY